MILELKIPALGESITQAHLSTWHVKDGQMVSTGQLLYDLETDKISTEAVAEVAGIVHIKVSAGSLVNIGDIVGHINTQEEKTVEANPKEKTELPKMPIENSSHKPEYVALSPFRKSIAKHLLEAKNKTATLTTFNEIDMYALLELRKKYQEGFKSKYGVKLGLMSFFVKAVIGALKKEPSINCFLKEDSILYNHYYDIGIAVGAEKGLIVPVLRGCEQKSLAEIEKDILVYTEKVKTSKIDLADLQGAVFTISNGGVYGSLLSTPLLNSPQSAILGIHAIKDRPVALNGKVLIRPMMYVALSYDHQVIDGKQAVSFLLAIKEYIETIKPEVLAL